MLYFTLNLLFKIYKYIDYFIYIFISNMLTLVCGADFRYYRNLKRLINNVITNVINNEIYNDTKINFVVYDLGLKPKELEEIKRFPHIILERFDFSLYPEHVSLEKYNGITCTYAWKPIIIYDVCEKYGDLVHWMDTRNLYHKEPNIFKTLISWLNENHFYTPTSNDFIRRWTHKTCIENMKEEGSLNYTNKRNRNAALIGINYNVEWCRELIKDWKKYSLIKECICPEGSDRTNHRQDQAVLSILYWKYEELHKFKTRDDYMGIAIHQ